jgi:putative spermidine/putrescine transport system permease protein
MRTAGRSRLVTAALVGPLAAFLVLTLVCPLGLMLWQSVSDLEVRTALPRTVALLSAWDPATPVPEAAYAALAADLAGVPGDVAARAAGRLNIEAPGLRTLFLSAANDPTIAAAADPKKALLDSNDRWGKPQIWLAIRAARGPLTPRFLLTALDLEQKPDGTIAWRGSDRAIYRTIYLRTFSVAAGVTAICFLLGLPLALYLASLSDTAARRLLLLIMLPLWTSVLVRAMAWILLLDENGLVNAALTASRLVSHPLTLVFNRFGVVVTMTHVLLPFMVLPIYNALRNVPRHQLWAAGSLGASPPVVLWRIYLPQCRAGIAAGLILVLASGAGYYITPALVGGGTDTMLGSFVQQAAIRNNNPGLAAGLGVVFLLIFLVVLAVVGAILRPRPFASRMPLGV